MFILTHNKTGFRSITGNRTRCQNTSRVIVLCAILLAVSLPASDVFVAPAGNDNAAGTLEAPFRTIQKGVFALRAGDRLILRGGRYHESTIVKDLAGRADSPIVICAHPEEKVILDGTVPIASIASGKWEPYRDGIYKIPLNRDIWQIIADGQIQTTARWPNASWQDDSLFDLKHWAMGSADDEWYDYPKRGLTGFYGVMGNTPDKKMGIDLKELTFNLTGAVAILNIANFDTYAFPVIEHNRSKGLFTFQIPEKHQIFHRPMAKSSKEDPVGKLIYRFHKYFFEGKLEFVDAPGEFHFDRNSRTLFFFPPHGQSPQEMDIRGKVQSYALELIQCQFVTLRGLHFYGTTLKGIGNKNLTVEDSDFKYPSYSRRVLGDCRAPEATVFYQAERKAPEFLKYNFTPSNLTLRNCKFQYADGDAVKVQGLGNVIENCYFHKIDYSCVDESSDPEIPQVAGNGGTVHTWWSPGVQVRRCTLDLAGEGHGFMGGMYSQRHKTNNVVEYCRAIRSGRLHAQDGANFHIWQFDCDYMTLRYNWAHDTFKYPFRLDGIFHEPQDKKQYLDHCLLYRLVGFKSVVPDYPDPVNGSRKEGNIGIAVKGEYHRTYHTTTFDNNTVGLFVRNELGGDNRHSDTRNNVSMSISGVRNGMNTTEAGRVNGTYRANWSGADEQKSIREFLRDADNLDFRPRAGSPWIDQGEVVDGINNRYMGAAPDLGAYEFGDDEYWIPGYQTLEASTPIPPDATVSARADCDLMWLGGYKAERHRIYVSESELELSSDSVGTHVLAFERSGSKNIVTPGALTPGKTYYWRVDALTGTAGKDEKSVRGRIWKFAVKK